MDEPKKPLAWLRRTLPWLAIIAVVAAIYDGSIFYSRWSSERDSKRAESREEAERARKTIELLGGDRLHIISFYASPGVIRQGIQATICYGVNGAKTVRIEPPVEDVRPALTRCLQVTPDKDTQYTLTAADAEGHSVSQSLVVKVTR